MKRGQFTITSEVFLIIPRLFLIIIVVAFVIAVVISYSNREFDTSDIEGHLLKQRLLYSSGCLVFEEEGKYFPGVVDLDKFDNNILSYCASYPESKGFKLSLKDMENNSITDDIFYNDDLTDLIPLCDVEEDKRNFRCYFKREYVLVEDLDEFSPAYLEIWMVTQHD